MKRERGGGGKHDTDECNATVCRMCNCMEGLLSLFVHVLAKILSWTWESGRTSGSPRALAMQPCISGTHMQLGAHSALVVSDQHCALHAAFCTRRGRRPRSIDWISMSATVFI